MCAWCLYFHAKPIHISEVTIWTEYSEAYWVQVGKEVGQYPPLIYSTYLLPSVLRKAGFKVDECDCNIREGKINNPC